MDTIVVTIDEHNYEVYADDFYSASLRRIMIPDGTVYRFRISDRGMVTEKHVFSPFRPKPETDFDPEQRANEYNALLCSAVA